jgi:hypothetical protein
MLQKRTVTPIRYSLIKLMSVSRLAYWSEKRRIERFRLLGTYEARVQLNIPPPRI